MLHLVHGGAQIIQVNGQLVLDNDGCLSFCHSFIHLQAGILQVVPELQWPVGLPPEPVCQAVPL